MKGDPNKFFGLVATILGLYVTIATIVSNAKFLPGLYWIGTGFFMMLGSMFLVVLAYGGYSWLREEVTREEPGDQEETVYLWLLGGAALAGLIATATLIGDPVSKDDAQHFGFLHVVGILMLVGGAALLTALYNDRTKQQEGGVKPD